MRRWLAVVGCLLLSGCGGEPYFLESFEIADLELDSAERVSRRVKKPGEALGKPTPGLLRLAFVPGSDDVSVEELAAEIAAVAESQGWVIREGESRSDFSGDARLAPGSDIEGAVLSIDCTDDPDFGEQAVRVWLLPRNEWDLERLGLIDE